MSLIQVLSNLFETDFGRSQRLNQLSSELKGSQLRAASAVSRNASLEADLSSLALLCLGLVASLVEKKVISEQDLLNHIQGLDTLDGFTDGKITMTAMREALGLAAPAPTIPLKKRKLPQQVPGKRPQRAPGSPSGTGGPVQPNEQ
ncbi:MAG: hypothetical protein IT463_06305 [Planctomycetes bacterium]|nr:hypothetical protein [Planctomycetota bacterium]